MEDRKKLRFVFQDIQNIRDFKDFTDFKLKFKYYCKTTTKNTFQTEKY